MIKSLKERRAEKKSWIVEIRCTVLKSVVLSNCTYDEARNNPWDYAEEETEIDQMDWEVTKVEENG